MIISIQILGCLLLSICLLCCSLLIYLVDLLLQKVTALVEFSISTFQLLFPAVEVSKVFLAPAGNLRSQTFCRLFRNKFFSEVTKRLEIQLKIKQESRNDRWNVVKFILFVLESLVVVVFSMRLRLPFG
jgi:hypothetical protein